MVITLEPQKVPVKLVNPIDHRLLFVIFAVVITFQVYIYSLQDEAESDFTVAMASFVFPLASAVAGFVVAKRYWHSEVFGKAYLALAIGLLMNFFGEISYYAYDSAGLNPIPSIADVFFLAFYPLTFYHLYKNIRFFKAKVNIVTKILIIIIPVSITGAYSVLSVEKIGSTDFDFLYGLSYVVGSSIAFSAAILGATIFKQGVLGTAWLVLTIGIALTTFGDNWYSYLETYDQYSLQHPVNLLWYGGYMVITYALYKHRDTI